MNQRIAELRNQIVLLGKEVAAEHTTTMFPEWCLLKIGLHKIQGLPYEDDYYEGLLETNAANENSN